MHRIAVICGLDRFAVRVTLIFCVILHIRVDIDDLLLGRIGLGIDNIIEQLDGIVLGFCSDKGNMHIAAGNGGINAEGIGGIVTEAIVQMTPVDGGIHTPGDIGRDILVLITLNNLKIGLQRTPVQGGSDLADAAAELVFGTAADIDTGFSIALFRSAFANGFVEGEDLAGLNNGAVDRFAGELQIVGTGGIPDMWAVIGCQNIGEKLTFELFTGVGRLDVSQGQQNGVTGQGVGQCAVGIGHFEAPTILTIGDLVGILVANGIDRRNTMIILEKLIQIDRLREFLLIDILKIKGANHVGTQDLLLERLKVDRTLDSAEKDLDAVDCNGISVLIVDVGGRVLDLGVAALLYALAQTVQNIIDVAAIINLKVFGDVNIDSFTVRIGGGDGAAVLVGLLDDLLQIEGDLNIGSRQAECALEGIGNAVFVQRGILVDRNFFLLGCLGRLLDGF